MHRELAVGLPAVPDAANLVLSNRIFGCFRSNQAGPRSFTSQESLPVSTLAISIQAGARAREKSGSSPACSSTSYFMNLPVTLETAMTGTEKWMFDGSTSSYSAARSARGNPEDDERAAASFTHGRIVWDGRSRR